MHGLIVSLEAKYSKRTAHQGKGKREPSVAPDEPSEEQFAAARSGLYDMCLHSSCCSLLVALHLQ